MRLRRPKYVNVYADRHGKVRIYYREPGRPQVALPGPLYCEAFWVAYHKAKEGERLVPGKAPAAGSVHAAIVGYYGSAEFKQLAQSSKTVYKRILDAFAEEHGNAPIAGIQTRHINVLLDKKADTPAAANILRKRLSQVFDYAVSVGMIMSNPAKDAKRIKTRSKGYRSWTEEDIAAFRSHWKEGTSERIAFEVLLHTGLRRSDAVRLGWQHIVGDSFVISTRKSQDIVELSIPLHVELAFIFDLPRGNDTFISTVYGKARSEKAFTNWIRGAAHKAGLPSDSSPHGLRKAACRRLAESGCTAHEIMSITGHRDIKEIERYTKAAEMKRLSRSAMEKSERSFIIKLPNP